jgi:signal transduction histidine kinase
MRRRDRVQRLFLYHLWACIPFALVWALWPAQVGASVEPRVGALRIVMGVGGVYLALRSWLTYRPVGGIPWHFVWPVADVALISIGITYKAGPAEWVVLLYLIPVTEAAATLDLRWAVLVGVLGAAGYVAASVVKVNWAFGAENFKNAAAAFRLFFLVLMASLLTNLGREVARAYRELTLADYKSRLAGEMHDGIQQYLAAIAMRLELARRMLGTDPTAAAQLAVDQRHVARQAADELRVLVRRLRSPALESEGLAEALRQYIALFNERSEVRADLHIAGDERRLDPAVEHAFLRITQEALNNVAKHAQATQVSITIEFGPDEVGCTIRDDGVGFVPAQAPTGGLGMETMRGRAADVHGNCEVTSAPGEGTTVVVRVPHRRPRAGTVAEGSNGSYQDPDC